MSKAKSAFRSGLHRLSLSTEAEAAMRNALFGLEVWERARNLFIYVSVFPEPDTHEIIRRALFEDKRVAVPRVNTEGSMSSRVVSDLSVLRPGMYGIPEPPECAPVMEQPDLVVIPCLACDRNGYRLGHGGGYYDRYLSTHECFSICLCPDELLFDSVPHDERDRKPDIILTQRSILYNQRKG